MEAPENSAEMRTTRTGKAVIQLATASRSEVEAALARWDQLEHSSLEALATHPVHGPRLRMLELAEAWLGEQGPTGRSVAVRRGGAPWRSSVELRRSSTELRGAPRSSASYR